MKDLPYQEALGIFVSVAGLDVLTVGDTQPWKALAIALAGAAFVIVRRRWRMRRNATNLHHTDLTPIRPLG